MIDFFVFCPAQDQEHLLDFWTEIFSEPQVDPTLMFDAAFVWNEYNIKKGSAVDNRVESENKSA